MQKERIDIKKTNELVCNLMAMFAIGTQPRKLLDGVKKFLSKMPKIKVGTILEDSRTGETFTVIKSNVEFGKAHSKVSYWVKNDRTGKEKQVIEKEINLYTYEK